MNTPSRALVIHVALASPRAGDADARSLKSALEEEDG
jgi:hypothetical protein